MEYRDKERMKWAREAFKRAYDSNPLVFDRLAEL